MGGGSSTPQKSDSGSSKTRKGSSVNKKGKGESFEIIQGIDDADISEGVSGNKFHDDEQFYELRRGGFVVQVDTIKTKFLQFGMPPETIKDAMDLGIEVPSTFVIFGELFDRARGLSIGEFEFPIYYNFFVKKRKVTIITSEILRDRIKKAFQETLFGPKEENLMLEYDMDDMEHDAWPNFVKEGNALDPARESMEIDHLVEFIIGDPTSSKGITYHTSDDPTNKEETIYIKKKLKVKGSDMVSYFQVKVGKRTAGHVPLNYFLQETVGTKSRGNVKPFEIPVYGITMLGASHGFDSRGRTTGFVIWSNRRGIMCDPPPDSSDILREMGIPPQAIESVIVTHCHADHDAGTFQKILCHGKITLITTRTIRDSFLRKYAAITGFDVEFLAGLFTFIPVTIGQPVRFHDSEIKFFYSLHTIPCVGFEVFFGHSGRSMVYSADTSFNRDVVADLETRGVIGKARAQQLLSFPFKNKHDLVFHEMGFPPIHTYKENLMKEMVKAGSKKFKSTLVIVHSKVDAATATELTTEYKCIIPKEFSTFRFLVDLSISEDNRLMRSVVQTIPWLSQVISKSPNDGVALFYQDLVQKVERCTYAKGDTIDGEGASVDALTVVIAGFGATPARDYIVGDFYGHDGLLKTLTSGVVENDTVQTSIIAKSNMQVMRWKYSDALSTAKSIGADFKSKLEMHLKEYTDTFSSNAWKALVKNPDLFRLLKLQMKEHEFLRILSDAKPFSVGDRPLVASKKKDSEHKTAIIGRGELKVLMDDSILTMRNSMTFRGSSAKSFAPGTYQPGTFIGDINSILKGGSACLVAEAVTDGILYEINMADMRRFLEDNPGFQLQMLDRICFGEYEPLEEDTEAPKTI